MKPVVASLLVLLLLSGCKVECRDGTVVDRDNKGSVACQEHGGEKVKWG